MQKKYKVLQAFGGEGTDQPRREVDEVIEIDETEVGTLVTDGVLEPVLDDHDTQPVDTEIKDNGTSTEVPPAPATPEVEEARQPSPAGGEDRARDEAIAAGQDVEPGVGSVVPEGGQY